ncbi:hypothetical protein LMG27198_01780 [Methylocystis echinoides]|uniref:ASCH domain-containing protein n=1 Tax=Methylocystis echinoides TaxID=29468 RepID=A0A9W6GQS5_9HYPH|nr:hypothetical protein LMG27198_01780 [Methylocystis echinoides]
MTYPRTLIFSIHPKWADEIFAGRKVFELRRRPPALKAPTQTLIYETAPRFRMRAICKFGPVISSSKSEVWKIAGNGSRISHEEYKNYFAGTETAHAIVIREVNLIGPWALQYLRDNADFVPPQGWCYASEKLLSCLGVT